MKCLILCLFLSSVVSGVVATCPPDGFDSVASFDIEQYIATSWYIQEQMPVFYQPESTLFCVVATYELQDPDDPFEGLNVFNYANNGEVNGAVRGSSDVGPGDEDFLLATIPDVNEPSKLLVGPRVVEKFLGQFANVFYGDYWVVAVGPISDPAVGYDWAIVSGGAPRVDTGNGCRTGRRYFSRFQTNDIGLWLFSRKPVDPKGTSKMRQVAKDLGFDISVLKKVEQKGCNYSRAFLKKKAL